MVAIEVVDYFLIVELFYLGFGVTSSEGNIEVFNDEHSEIDSDYECFRFLKSSSNYIIF